MYCYKCFVYVKVAAPVKAAAEPRQWPVGHQQSVQSGKNSRGDLSHLGETGKR